MTLLAFIVLCLSVLMSTTQSAPPKAGRAPAPNTPQHLFEVVELRRYAIKPGQREHFAQYFETYGVMQDESALMQRFVRLDESSRQRLAGTQLLSGAVERVVLTPTRRSRLRWVTPQ